MLTDEPRTLIEPHFPKSTARTGRPMADRRRAFEAALVHPRDRLPVRGASCHASGSACPGRPPSTTPTAGDARASIDRLARAMLARVDAAGRVDWSLFCADGASVRAAACAAGARRRASPRAQGLRADHALGRSRGGVGTKVHLATCGNGVPVAAIVSAGQAHESAHVDRLLDAASASDVVAGPGRSRATRATAIEGSARTCAAAASGP